MRVDYENASPLLYENPGMMNKDKIRLILTEGIQLAHLPKSRADYYAETLSLIVQYDLVDAEQKYELKNALEISGHLEKNNSNMMFGEDSLLQALKYPLEKSSEHRGAIDRAFSLITQLRSKKYYAKCFNMLTELHNDMKIQLDFDSPGHSSPLEICKHGRHKVLLEQLYKLREKICFENTKRFQTELGIGIPGAWSDKFSGLEQSDEFNHGDRDDTKVNISCFDIGVHITIFVIFGTSSFHHIL